MRRWHKKLLTELRQYLAALRKAAAKMTVIYEDQSSARHFFFRPTVLKTLDSCHAVLVEKESTNTERPADGSERAAFQK